MNPFRHLRRWTIVLLAAALLMTMGQGLATPALGQGGDLTNPPASARVSNLTHYYQTWNNCGPANLTMALSYYGWGYDQAVAASWLKPNVEDKNVSPDQMAAYVNQHNELPNMAALWRYGGTLDLLKRFVAAGFPVVIEAGYVEDGLGWMGHYQTVVAYDDNSQTIWVYDSYKGPGGQGRAYSYADFDYWWRHFNRVFVVPFPLDREGDMRIILGDYASVQYATEQALQTALDEAAANPADNWAWFNAGTAAVRLGRSAMGNGDAAGANTYYNSAAFYFDEAFRLEMPYRTTWYQFGPYEAYYFQGRY
ncbi:MAG: hypothetical protein GYB65_05815, partial [Chloroflexi bacterium]|nr:hypothetical protein [Chloroflexota bacterium]